MTLGLLGYAVIFRCAVEPSTAAIGDSPCAPGTFNMLYAHGVGEVPISVSAIDAAEGASRPMISIERFDFYDIARDSYAVIQTGERRFYGCFMLRKGVIPPEA